MKPLLIGMCNPYGDDPLYALHPWPANCAGWRVWQLLRRVRPDATQHDYRKAFDRTNLLSAEFAQDWDAQAAREAAREMMTKVRKRDWVVVFGNAVRDAFAKSGAIPGLLSSLPLDCAVLGQSRADTVVYFLPHPSGRCHWYNDAANAKAAAEILGVLYDVGATERRVAA